MPVPKAVITVSAVIPKPNNCWPAAIVPLFINGSDQFDLIKLQVESTPSFKTLKPDEQTAVYDFLELSSKQGKSPNIMLSETDSFISKLLLDPSRVKQIPLEDRKFLQRLKLLLQNPKKLALYIGSGTILVITALVLTGNIGSARRLYNENEQDWKEADPDNQETEEGTNSECPGESSFKSAIETAYGGIDNVDVTKYGVFDTEKCAGIYDGSTYTWNNMDKDWN